MRRIAFASLIAILGLTLGATVSSATPSVQRSGIFDYDSAAPLDVALGATATRAGIVRQALSYQVTTSLRLKATFIHPTTGGPWPIVIWSPGAGSDRFRQLPEALTLARGGTASLLIDETPLARCDDPQANLESHVDYVISRRRAVDVAETLENVDSTRIGAAGFSRGAAVTADLAGVEHRVHVFALESGRGHLTGYIPIFCKQLTAVQLRASTAVMAAVDPIRWLRRATGATLLIQNGTKDELSPRADVLALYAVAKKPKELHWYPADHPLNAAATADRDRWLLDHLRPR